MIKCIKRTTYDTYNALHRIVLGVQQKEYSHLIQSIKYILTSSKVQSLVSQKLFEQATPFMKCPFSEANQKWYICKRSIFRPVSLKSNSCMNILELTAVEPW